MAERSFVLERTYWEGGIVGGREGGRREGGGV
jgi:hypothetical protein